MRSIINKKGAASASQRRDGFTLLETLIYIALLSIIMGGALVAAYGLVGGSQKINTRTIIQDEGNFVLRKIVWVVSNTSGISMPSEIAPNSDVFSATLRNGNNITIRFDAPNHAIEISKNGMPFELLTSANVKVESLNFNYLSGSPAGISVSTTINGFLFETTRHLRY